MYAYIACSVLMLQRQKNQSISYTHTTNDIIEFDTYVLRELLTTSGIGASCLGIGTLGRVKPIDVGILTTDKMSLGICREVE